MATLFGSFSRRPEGGGDAAQEGGAAGSGKETRAELLHRIQTLLEQNQRFELRFRDVVKAYKSVLKEKAALENTVAALTGGDEPAEPPGGVTAGEDARTEGPEVAANAQESSTAAGSDGEVEGAATDAGPEPPALKSQGSSRDLTATLATLKASLRTITAEKNTMQARFQGDKRAVAEAHREALASLNQEHARKALVLQQSIDQLRSEKEGLDGSLHQVTQQLLAGHELDMKKDAGWERERKALSEEIQALTRQLQHKDGTRERIVELEEQLQQSRDAELEALTQLSSSTAALRDRVQELEEELVQTQTRLAAVESRGESEDMLKVKKELRSTHKLAERYKAQASEAVGKERDALFSAQKRVELVEAQLGSVTQQQEERDRLNARERMMFENRVSELSALVGRYEKTRLEDARVTSELREEIADLVDDNRQLKELLKKAENSPKSSASDENVAALQEKIGKLKSLLYLSNQRLLDAKAAPIASRTPSSELLGLPEPTFGVVGEDDYVAEAQGLRDQVMAYYERSKALLRDRNDQARLLALATEDKEQADAQLAALRHSQEAVIADACKQLVSEKLALQVSLEGEIDALQKRHKTELTDLQKRNQRTRERTVALLADNDAEISRLRKLAGLSEPEGGGSSTAYEGQDAVTPLPTLSRYNSSPSPAHSDPSSQPASRRDSIRLLNRPASPFDSMSAGGPLMHVASLEAERRNERAEARLRVRELEQQNMDLEEQGALAKDQLVHLKEEIRRLERNAARKGANLEYLKNIVIKYIADPAKRHQTLPAIATILQFSPAELKGLQKQTKDLSSSWWPGGGGSPA